MGEEAKGYGACVLCGMVWWEDCKDWRLLSEGDTTHTVCAACVACMESPLDADEAFNDTRRLCEVASRYCCLHVVIEDMNLDDSSVEFALATAKGNNHTFCDLIAQRIHTMTLQDRIRLLDPHNAYFTPDGERVPEEVAVAQSPIPSVVTPPALDWTWQTRQGSHVAEQGASLWPGGMRVDPDVEFRHAVMAKLDRLGVKAGQDPLERVNTFIEWYQSAREEADDLHESQRSASEAFDGLGISDECRPSDRIHAVVAEVKRLRRENDDLRAVLRTVIIAAEPLVRPVQK